jgi:hypothetical protein
MPRPKVPNYMSAGFQWRDYSRDFRTTEWGSTVILQGNNHEPGMSALGQKQISDQRPSMFTPKNGHR